MSVAAGQQFDLLLDYLHRTHGFDFTGYKRPSLYRRISKRLAELQLRQFDQYLD